jgi:mono/diheme cytochrome c family protein
MDQTFFFVVGIGLVVLALVISFVGMRLENFPSDWMRRAGVLLVALVVVVTGASAVKSAQDEQEKRTDEANREAATKAAVETAQNEEAGGGGSASSVQEEPPKPVTGPGDDQSEPSGEANAAAGAQVFTDNACGSCHTLSAQGAQAVGTIGPNLDEALVDKDPDFIRTSIVNPSAEVEDGFGDGIMPSDFEEKLAPDDLDALVAYLSQATSGK